jgi:hypothetical protein
VVKIEVGVYDDVTQADDVAGVLDTQYSFRVMLLDLA